MISHRLRAILVHIPKTGGTSIERIVWRPNEFTERNLYGSPVRRFLLRPPWRIAGNRHQTGGLQHLTAVQIAAEVGQETFNSFYTFTIVRNPFDRLVSQYEYTRQMRPDLSRYLGLGSNTSFKTYLKRLRWRPHVQWKPQAEFIYDRQDRLLVDEVFRLERIDEAIMSLRRRFDFPEQETPKLHATDRRPYQDYFDTEARCLVERLYARDLALLQYAFED